MPKVTRIKLSKVRLYLQEFQCENNFKHNLARENEKKNNFTVICFKQVRRIRFF